MRLAVVAFIVMWCFAIFSPFLMPVAWGVIIAIALHPIFVKLKSQLGGRNRLAGTLFIVVSLVVSIVPAAFLADSLIHGTVNMGRQLADGQFSVPPPAEKVKDWPLIGERLHGFWMLASENARDAAVRIAPQLKAFGRWLISAFTGLSASFVMTLIALIIAGILMMNSAGAGRAAQAIGRRLGGNAGEEMIGLSANTIRSVFRGVLLVAIIQGLLAGIGLYVAGVPAAGLCAILVMIVAIIQVPTLVILGPIVAYVFMTHDSTAMAIGFAIWSIIVSLTDNILKPIFLGRGVQVPMLVVLIGAIGGMIGAGIIGLFIGPVVLSIGYEIFVSWVGEGQSHEEP